MEGEGRGGEGREGGKIVLSNTGLNTVRGSGVRESEEKERTDG